jgi:AIPR protein
VSTAASATHSRNKALAAFEGRDDLAEYGSNGLLLFGLQLRHGVQDVTSVASTALTDGGNDKKCDLVYVDRGAARIVIGQVYVSAQDKSEAPADKAADLNTAVGWLIAGDLDGLPEALRSAAVEVRDALENDEITEFEIWYTHNLPESKNVKRELETAAKTADSLITRHFPDAQVDCSGLEMGLGTLEELYRRTEAPIAVTEKFELTLAGGFEERSGRWKAFTTSVPATWLRKVWIDHDADLMSPNVRYYLGNVKSEQNINNGIKMTATRAPGEFWIYNNGITILVHSYAAKPDTDGKWKLTIEGLGIVNGAQTTGSLGTLDAAGAKSLEQASVLARFVTCDDPDVLADIVKYNNTQNKVEAADFRSKDPVQERLRAEFATVPDADYRGARRGGVKEAIERSRNLLPDSAVAQALAAFHGEPNLAYNETRRIWVDDGTYARYFNDRTTARHVVLTFSLLRSVEATKKRLTDLPEEKRADSQKKQAAFFSRRGSTLLLGAAIAASIETFLDRPVADRWSLRFRDNCAPAEGATRWQPIVDAALSFAQQLGDATDLGLKNPDTVTKTLELFQSFIVATADSNRERYAVFAAEVSDTAPSDTS